MVINCHRTLLVRLIYISQTHILTVCPVALSVNGIVEFEIDAGHK